VTIHVLVTGSRDLLDPDQVTYHLERLCAEHVFVGDCPTGADKFTRDWCAANGVRCEVFRADWQKDGKSAGPRRNRRMVRRAKECPPTFVLAFPRGGPGTADCIAQAKRAGLLVSEK
jgi:YspA, cpYpsA-related SLOG family